jgi:hypothetical protein
MIKLIKFGGDWIVTELQEIPDCEFGDPDCILKYPYQIEGNCFAPWPLYASEREIVVRSSDITVITEPKKFNYEQYISLVYDEKQEESFDENDVIEEFED